MDRIALLKCVLKAKTRMETLRSAAVTDCVMLIWIVNAMLDGMALIAPMPNVQMTVTTEASV